MVRPILTACLCLLATLAASPVQARVAQLRAAKVTTPVATLQHVRARLDWADGTEAGELQLWAGRIEAPDLGYRFRDLHWRCPLRRAANAGWGSIQDLGGGNYGTIAADGQGNVYLAWSADFNIKFCRRTLSSGCNDQRTFSEGSDFAPSLGVTGDGNVLLAWRETEGKKLWYNTREGGGWTGDKQVASGPTDPDVSARAYTNRLGLVWSLDWEIQLVTVGVSNQPTVPTPTAPPSICSGSRRRP